MGNWRVGVSGIHNYQLACGVKRKPGPAGTKIVNRLLGKLGFKGIHRCPVFLNNISQFLRRLATALWR